MAQRARARSTCAAGALSERRRRVSAWRSSAVSGRRGSFRWRDMGHLGARGSPHHDTSSHDNRPTREVLMSVVKFLELSAQSPQGYEDAVRQAVERATSTIRNVQSVWVKEFEAVVENDKVTQFRVNVKLSFLLDEGAGAG